MGIDDDRFFGSETVTGGARALREKSATQAVPAHARREIEWGREILVERNSHRSLVYRTLNQNALAEKSKAALAAKLGKTVATDIAPLGTFYPAEEYHKECVRRNPHDFYVLWVAVPKLKKLHLKIPE